MSSRQFAQHPDVVTAGNVAFQEAYDELVKTTDKDEARARAHDQRLAAQREMIDELIASET